MKVIQLIMLLISLLLPSSDGNWEYDGPDGEYHWSRHYPYCGGAFQSPIDIQPEMLRYDPDLLPIRLHDYNLPGTEQLTLSNNGHSLQLSLPSRMHFSGLPHRYSAAQLHFHWGSSNVLAGSEHTVNGKQFAAETKDEKNITSISECKWVCMTPHVTRYVPLWLLLHKQAQQILKIQMHVVHFNSAKYHNLSMAVDKSDGLAVLGVFIEVGEFNPAFEHFLKFAKDIKYKDQKIQVPAFNIRELLPARLNEYYRYDGSLTTPPCYPSVLWTLFRNSMTVSLRQYLALASALFSSHAQETAPVPLLGNYRKPQLMDNRVVLVSFQDGWALHGTLSVSSPMQRRLVIQQLLTGDLADLADEDLNNLLPKLLSKHLPTKKSRNNQSQKSGSNVAEKQQRNHMKDAAGNNSVWKNTKPNSYMDKYVVNDDALCFMSLEKNVSTRLTRHRAERQLVQALKKAVFPELNLKSYLNCKSDLDVQTIRYLLSFRATDEATELEQALTKATQGEKRKQMTRYQGSALTKLTGKSQAAVLKNSHRMVPTNHRLQRIEWED